MDMIKPQAVFLGARLATDWNLSVDDARRSPDRARSSARVALQEFFETSRTGPHRGNVWRSWILPRRKLRFEHGRQGGSNRYRDRSKHVRRGSG